MASRRNSKSKSANQKTAKSKGAAAGRAVKSAAKKVAGKASAAKKSLTKGAKRAAKTATTLVTKKKTAKKSAAKSQPLPKKSAKAPVTAATKPVKLVPEARKQMKKPAFNKNTDSANDPSWVAPVWNDDVLLGAHVSVAGGSHEAPRRAQAIGATAMQIFTKMANRWAERVCEDAECRAFRDALANTRVRDTIAHDSYLINLATPDETLRRRSVESFVAELQRCAALGLTYLVSHPGNYIDDRASGIHRNSDGIAEALDRAPGNTILCMEITSGSGTAIGSTFEDLAALIDGVPAGLRDRIGICVDTCHAYSAGYDLVNAYDDVWKRFDDVLGMSRLKVMHLNDSKTPFNSKRDRHELIGEGSLGERAFQHVMNDPRLARIAKV
ncbi:MAG TPA: deoxyribonuclease IV, partial [Gemmatimonadaceae bacterium]